MPGPVDLQVPAMSAPGAPTDQTPGWTDRIKQIVESATASMSDVDRSDELVEMAAEDARRELAVLNGQDPDDPGPSEPPPVDDPGDAPIDGAALLDDLVTWWARFISVTNADDLDLLALWSVHTHLVDELYTTPRLLVDSIMEGSGKTTVLEHLNKLCINPIQAASISSPALIPRLLDKAMRTILIDEAHRALRKEKPGVEDLLGIVNTGYKKGATRPVLVPSRGGGWDVDEMSTFAPVAMAGNNPDLPADTMSRQIRILLMPDVDGTIEDSDWEAIETDAKALRERIASWADAVRDDVKGLNVELPARCIGRCKEKWRPLARVAAAAGKNWPPRVYRLIEINMAEEEAEREAGLKKLPPGMIIMRDLYAIWVEDEPFVPTRQLVTKLILHNPDYWGAQSAYGKPLTDTRFGKLVAQAAKVQSTRIDRKGSRGYLYSQLLPVWRRLGITPRIQPDALDAPDANQGSASSAQSASSASGLDKGASGTADDLF